MSRHVYAKCLCILSAVTMLTGCASLSGALYGKKKAGPGQVDDLLGRIERVHIECEPPGESVRKAITSLHTLASPEFDGDPVLAYTAFVEEVEGSKKRADALRSTVGPMKTAAGPFFDQWAAKMGGFSSMEMRLRSQARLEGTLTRYREILNSIEPAQAAFDAFNSSLHDHVLYLGHDLNATAISELEGEIDALTTIAEDLDVRFNACLTAAQEYVRAAALPGQLEVAQSVGGGAGDER